MAFKKVFDQAGTFQALDACRRWLDENGYSYGSSSAMHPIPVLKGDWCIAKWRNLTKAEIKALDGSVTGEIREGPVTLYLKQAPEAAQGDQS